MIYLSRFCMIIMTVMFRHIRIFHIRIKGKKSNTTDLVSICVMVTMETGFLTRHLSVAMHRGTLPLCGRRLYLQCQLLSYD